MTLDRAMFYVGTDTGGTFTDAVVIDAGGERQVFKALTTPEDRSAGVLDVLRLAAEAYGLELPAFVGRIAYFAHGTTTATNALIERKGVRTGLITTKGFGDTLLLQRTMASWAGMGDEFTHYSARRETVPIIPRELIREVTERVDHQGAVLVPLAEDELRAAIVDLLANGVRSLAVCFLWSFVNAAHERRAAEVVRQEAPGVFCTTSHELAAVMGEYERTATTAINSYLGPTIRDYVSRLKGRLTDCGFTGTFSIMDSGGGVMFADEAGDRPVRLLNSGPAGGVLASVALARSLGIGNAITTDMGGTSFDVGLIVDGQPLVSSVTEIGKYHIVQPVLDVQAIGAGGGSIARVEDGYLFVGPESAGADPGPACYGRGGTEPTITDADVVLGIIDPEFFLGGRMRLDREAAAAAIRGRVAEPLRIAVEDAAAGIREIADQKMADLLRNATVQRGYDPRDFVLFAYGGAGPTHCHRYAGDLGVQSIIIPAAATGWSAYGAVTSDRHYSCSLTDLLRTPPGIETPAAFLSADRISSNLARLEAEARAALGGSDGGVKIRRYVGVRYRRQVRELSVEVPPGRIDGGVIEELVARFERAYESSFGKGTGLRAAGFEITTFRVEASAPVARAERRAVPSGATGGPVATRRVYQGKGVVQELAVYRGDRLGAGSRVAGPAIIEHPGTTLVVGAGQVARIDDQLNTILTLDSAVAS